MHGHAGLPEPGGPRQSPLRSPRSSLPRSSTSNDGKDRMGILDRSPRGDVGDLRTSRYRLKLRSARPQAQQLQAVIGGSSTWAGAVRRHHAVMLARHRSTCSSTRPGRATRPAATAQRPRRTATPPTPPDASMITRSVSARSGAFADDRGDRGGNKHRPDQKCQTATDDRRLAHADENGDDHPDHCGDETSDQSTSQLFGHDGQASRRLTMSRSPRDDRCQGTHATLPPRSSSPLAATGRIAIAVPHDRKGIVNWDNPNATTGDASASLRCGEEGPRPS